MIAIGTNNNFFVQLLVKVYTDILVVIRATWTSVSSVFPLPWKYLTVSLFEIKQNWTFLAMEYCAFFFSQILIIVLLKTLGKI